MISHVIGFVDNSPVRATFQPHPLCLETEETLAHRNVREGSRNGRGDHQGKRDLVIANELKGYHNRRKRRA